MEMEERIIKFFKFIGKVLLVLSKVVIVGVITITIIINLFGYFFPYQKIDNFDKLQTLKLLNESIQLSDKDINQIIFSQSMYLTFLGDGGYDIFLEITDDAKKRIIESKESKIGEFTLENIKNKNKCSFVDYNNRDLEIVNRGIYEENNFYYISKDYEYGGGIYLYISEKDNNLYYCNYRT